MEKMGLSARPSGDAKKEAWAPSWASIAAGAPGKAQQQEAGGGAKTEQAGNAASGTNPEGDEEGVDLGKLQGLRDQLASTVGKGDAAVVQLDERLQKERQKKRERANPTKSSC